MSSWTDKLKEKLQGEFASKFKEMLKGKLVAGGLIILVLLTSYAGLWEKLELNMYDTWFNLRGVRQPIAEVVVVGMDDRSIRDLGILPWPRQIHARFIETLKEANVIGFDVSFDTPGTPEDNARLAAAIKAHGRVVLAMMFSFEQEAGNAY